MGTREVLAFSTSLADSGGANTARHYLSLKAVIEANVSRTPLTKAATLP
jgi:hypothetical protein